VPATVAAEPVNVIVSSRALLSTSVPVMVTILPLSEVPAVVVLKNLGEAKVTVPLLAKSPAILNCKLGF